MMIKIINICILCENVHIDHHIILYSKVISEKEAKLAELNKFRESINLLKEEVDNVTKDLNNFVENVETLFNIYEKMIKQTNKQIENIEKIEKIKEKIRQSNSRNEIILHYEFNSQNEKIILFGSSFVENNIDNCFIKHDGKNFLLQEYYYLGKDFDFKKGSTTSYSPIIKLVGINNIINMESMFEGCMLEFKRNRRYI